MNTPMEHAAVISDRQRLWEVRKHCQVRAVLGQCDVQDGESTGQARMAAEPPNPDPALSSLLRLLMNQLDADLVMVSLLDEETQFFLAGVKKGSNELPIEFPTWFGCDSVSYFGGLCERTIAVDSTQPPAIYEELDMSENSRTKSLPYVQGPLAKFRHYAGAPVKTAAGIPVGTVFVMSDQPSSGLDTAKQQLLVDVADNVMRQLTLTLQALEGERLMRFQSATSDLLLQRQQKNSHQRAKVLPRRQSGIKQSPDYIVEIYQHAAEIMRRSLELEGVLFQSVPSENQQQTASGNTQDLTLATSLSTESSRPICLTRLEVDKIIQMFPQGAVLHHFDGEWLTSVLDDSRYSLDPEITAALHKSFQDSQQLLVMPLFDVIHDRTAAICVGWLNDYSRVYSDRSDLPFVSAFCMFTMSEGLRLETQMLARVKSDFLGSISHEMKTPLHQILGNLELLLQTDCSDEQSDLIFSAKFGGNQLHETISKVLEYSRISSESDTKVEDGSETDTSSDEMGVPQIIGPRVEHVASAASAVDFVRMCEEVVEDTTKRMRLLETVMNPTGQEQLEQHHQEPDGLELSAKRADSREKHPFTIVVLDASPIERVQVPRNTGFRLVLENLLSNAIKFTRAGCCVRVSLEFTPNSVELIVSDCGYGMSEDFVRHSMYLPFSQQNPVSSGMGLGLSIVKRNVDSLGGSVNIETDQDLGTTAKISIRNEDLLAEADMREEVDGKIPLGVIPNLPKRSREDLPFMHACFYAPSTWLHRYDKRDRRSIDLMFDSLSATLGEWYQPVLSLWQQKTRTTPDLIFISQHNLAQFQEENGEAFTNVKKVVICAAIGKNSSEDREKIRQASSVADTVITGAVLPSKLWEVVTGYFPHILRPGSNPDLQAAQARDDNEDVGGSQSSRPDESEEALKEQDEGHDSSSRNSLRELVHGSGQSSHADNGNRLPGDASTNLGGPETYESKDIEAGAGATPENEGTANQLSKTVTVPPTETGKAALKRNLTVPIYQDSAHPRLLLVDDNNLNLKMLGMFVKKCEIPTTQSTSVPGGQEAIDAFKTSNGTAKSFDIILMDLSMPEVSGFEATSAIRQIEKASDCNRRAYIVALTGLVSDKDRDAAYEAGVDDYVTKPAGLEKVRNIIETWRKRKNDIDG